MVTTRDSRVDEADPAGHARAVLYDADGSDREVPIDDVKLDALEESQLVWVDIARDEEGTASRICERIGLKDSERALGSSRSRRPELEAFDDFFLITMFAVNEHDGHRPVQLRALVGPKWIITAHESSIDLLGAFNDPLKGETELGGLEGPTFLAILLNWLFNGYYHVLEDLEVQVDRLDEKLLTREMEEEDFLVQLVRCRRRITRLRRVLAPHRDVLATLAEPDSNVYTPSKSAATYRDLHHRLEKAIEAIDGTREMLLGSFDVFMTQTTRRTNDVVKTLTVVSVLLLPAIVVAGIMGMNFRVGLFDHPFLFWVMIVGMVGLALGTLAVARLRRWI